MARLKEGKDSTTQALKGATKDVAVSKAMSYVLRHAAQREGIKMDQGGYVRCDELLTWRRLRAHYTTFDDLISVVRTNAKQRFSLLYSIPSTLTSSGPEPQPGPLGPESIPPQPGPLGADVTEPQHQPDLAPGSEPAPLRTPHEDALFRYDQPPETRDRDPSHYLVRATQGHSLPVGLVNPSTYLKPITLADESSIPETVVHGTFYPAWANIVRSGGLKRMGRVHVHFATGPSAADVSGGSPHGPEDVGDGYGNENPDEANTEDTDNQNAFALSTTSGAKPDVVRSGMRNDAPILIYLDIRRALKEGYTFWTSENGVVLCDGVKTTTSTPLGEANGKNKENETEALIPAHLFSVVLERAHGLGTLWEDGSEVQELPGRLVKEGKGKGGGRGGTGGKGSGPRGYKPRRPALGYIGKHGEAANGDEGALD